LTGQLNVNARLIVVGSRVQSRERRDVDVRKVMPFGTRYDNALADVCRTCIFAILKRGLIEERYILSNPVL